MECTTSPISYFYYFYFGTRLGGNVRLWAAGDLLFGGSWNMSNLYNFWHAFRWQYGPTDRLNDASFGFVSKKGQVPLRIYVCT